VVNVEYESAVLKGKLKGGLYCEAVVSSDDDR